MKLLTTITAAVLVMAATGCVSDNPAYEAARARNLERHKQPFKPTFQPGLDMMGIAPSTVVFNDAPAPAPAVAPQPVIVMGQGGGTTLATQVGGTTVVSQFGGYRPPIYTAPVPIYTGNQTPAVYTMPIQQ
jgi:hypothetical protein